MQNQIFVVIQKTKQNPIKRKINKQKHPPSSYSAELGTLSVFGRILLLTQQFCDWRASSEYK